MRKTTFRLMFIALPMLLGLASCSKDDDNGSVVQPTKEYFTLWNREAGYHVISMKNDFRTIYGDGVVKTDFTFPVN